MDRLPHHAVFVAYTHFVRPLCMLAVVALILVGANASAAVDTSARLLKDVSTDKPEEPGSSPGGLTAIGNTLYFIASDGSNDQSLWKSDGTREGTSMVWDPSPSERPRYPRGLTAINNTLLFFIDDANDNPEMWLSDGMFAGTVRAKDRIPALANFQGMSPFVFINQTAYFIAQTEGGSPTLWKTDGTAVGTAAIRTIGAPAHQMTNVGGTLFFTVAAPNNKWDLWKSNGTAQGTVVVKEGQAGVESFSFRHLVNVNGTLFFTIDIESNDANGFPQHTLVLAKSDGTTAGTVVIKPLPVLPYGDPPSFDIAMTAVGSTLFFVNGDTTTGLELWKSDGTASGTLMLKDIYPGERGSIPTRLINMNGMLFFTAGDQTTARNLWKSDGTAAGTVLVTDAKITLGAEYGTEPYFWPVVFNLNGTLFFDADDGVHGRELWKSDGTPAGTMMVRDINAVNKSSKFGGPSFGINDTSQVVDVNGILYFATMESYRDAILWRSDGTEQGTVELRRFPRLDDEDTYIDNLTNVNGMLFFSVKNGRHYGDELWKSDGTVAGTVLVKNMSPVTLSSRSPIFTPLQ